MIVMRKELREIFVDEEKLNFTNGLLTVSETNGYRSWEIDIDGAESNLSSIIRNKDRVNLRMVTTDGKVLNGPALATNHNTFKGAGAIV